MTETALHFSGVTFGFGKDRPLFQGFTCSLKNDSSSGKIIALMGPSGVGKTTFCDLAMGTHRPQSGAISFSPTSARFAVIPQRGVLFNELSVRDNITCLQYSQSLGASFREDRVPHAVESLNLGRVVQNNTRTAALSGGEAQRVMLARIQTIDCNFLVLDEPCSFLDNRVKDSFLKALRTTVDEQRLLALMVTHVWEEARHVADEVLFFHQAPGQPVTAHKMTPDEAFRRPPTLDAMFAIHWPDCRLIDLEVQAEAQPRPGVVPPPGARYVAIARENSRPGDPRAEVFPAHYDSAGLLI